MAKVELTRDDWDDLAGWMEENQIQDGRLNKMLSNAQVYGEWDQ